MELVLQPYRSKICGHCCVAMVANKTVEQVTEYIGHSYGTKTRDIISVLNNLGIKNSGKLKLLPRHRKTELYNLPETCLLVSRTSNEQLHGNWHWIVYHKGEIYCPSAGKFKSLDNYLIRLNAAVSSYLEVTI